MGVKDQLFQAPCLQVVSHLQAQSSHTCAPQATKTAGAHSLQLDPQLAIQLCMGPHLSPSTQQLQAFLLPGKEARSPAGHSDCSVPRLTGIILLQFLLFSLTLLLLSLLSSVSYFKLWSPLVSMLVQRYKIINIYETGEMAQWLRSLADLAETWP